MAGNEANKVGQRVSSILLDLAEKGIYVFSVSDVAKGYNMAKSTTGSYLKCGVNLGFLHMEENSETHNIPIYAFNRDRVMGVRYDGLSMRQKEILTAIYNVFKTREFRLRDAVDITSLQENSTVFHLHQFVQRGIMKARTSMGRFHSYWIAVTPKNHPACFLPDSHHDEQAETASGEPVKYPYAAAGA